MKDYFVYLPDAPHAELWGAGVTAIGYTKISVESSYPPARHPDDHHFSWERGRVLQTHQLIFIGEGGGRLETGRPGQAWRVSAGQVLLLFPGVWHRYEPDPETGWTEHWIECRGRVFEEATRRGLITPAQPLVDLGDGAAVAETFLRCHDCVARGEPRSLPTLGLHLLNLVIQARTRQGEAGGLSVATRLEQARRLLMERCDRPLDLGAVARAVGLGYSHLRQAFRRESGVGAREFHAEARLRRACDLLANTELSVKEIAELLGFSSAYHFSASFKAARGLAPSLWRGRSRPPA